MVRTYSVYAFCPICAWCNISTLHMLKDIAGFESQKTSCMYDSLMEPEETRRERLRRRIQRDRDRRAAESPQQREAQLARRRVRDTAHCALRYAAQWERVLSYRRRRLASETPDQRTSRLQQMTLAQQVRLTPWDSGSERGPSRENEHWATDETDPCDSRSERGLSRVNEHCTTEETDPRDSGSERGLSQASETWPMRLWIKEAHLQQVSLAQQRRCEQDRESHRIWRETFPGLSVRTVSPDSNDIECVRCIRDKRIPKLYLSLNNKTLVLYIPPKLQVAELALNDTHTWFLGNYIVVSACAKFNFLIVFILFGLILHFEQIIYRWDLTVPHMVNHWLFTSDLIVLHVLHMEQGRDRWLTCSPMCYMWDRWLKCNTQGKFCCFNP